MKAVATIGLAALASYIVYSLTSCWFFVPFRII
jgi:hypothetical protein